MREKTSASGETTVIEHENNLIKSLMSRKNDSSDKKPFIKKKNSKKKGVL